MPIGVRKLWSRFLSDLCGREDLCTAERYGLGFLSDLCGREAKVREKINAQCFLSDLCGREVLKK